MSPIDVQDILERAKNCTQLGDHEEAERLLKNYLVKVPDSRDASLLLGTTFAKEGKLNEAADQFIALLAKYPMDIEALNNAAVICRRQGKLEEALDYLKEAIEINPTRADFFYNIGNIHKQMNNPKAASMAYAKVIELDPNYVSAYNNLGTIYQQLKEYDKAYGVFRKGLSLDQNNPTLHFNYGVTLEENGSFEEAANEYRSALRSKPGWLAPMNNLGIILFKQGHHDKAVSTFNHILKTDPYNAEAYNNIGVVLSDQGRSNEAVKNYRQAIEADPRYIKAVVNLERTLESSGDISDALIELEKLVKLAPDSADIRNRLAGLYLKMERYPEALEQAEAALDWEPENIQALRIRGSVKRVMGDDAEAEICFEKILSLDPGNYSFLLDLADISFRRKEYKEAEERIQSYLIRRPNDREAKLLLGKLYAEMGNRTHAIQVFEELAKADPNDTEALAAAAELHKKAGSLEKAVRTADTLVNLQGKRATADDLTELNRSLEFYESAVKDYSSSVREMWDRNIKILNGGNEEAPEDDDVSMLMGSIGISQDIDEETESLFIEGPESFLDEDDDDELVLDDESFEDLLEEPETSRFNDSLDDLADESEARGSFPGAKETPAPSPPPAAEDSGIPPPQDGGFPGMPEPPVNPYNFPPDIPKFPDFSPDKQASPPAKEEQPKPGSPAFGTDEEEEEIFLGEEPPKDELLFSDENEPIDTDDLLPEEDTLKEISEPEPEPETEIADEPETEFVDEPESLEELGIEPELPAEQYPPEKPSPEQTPREQLPVEEGQKETPAPPVDIADRLPPLDAVIGLLDYLKSLTANLPSKQKDTYMHGRFPVAMDSVIDSLRKLVIIKESVQKTGSDPEWGGDAYGS